MRGPDMRLSTAVTLTAAMGVSSVSSIATPTAVVPGVTLLRISA